MSSDKQTYKTIGFDKVEDADLLQWCLDRPELFTPFVKRILRQAMEAEASAGGQHHQPAIDLAAVEAAAARGAARALASATITTAPAQPIEAPEIDEALETNLASLF